MHLFQFCLISLAAIVVGTLSTPASASNVGVVGLFQGKAVLVIDSGEPKTWSVGQSSGGVKLIATDGNAAVLEVDGKRRLVPVGSHSSQAGPGSTGSAGNDGRQLSNKVTLTADTNGHYNTQVNINGTSMPMLLDTGATMIALPARDATRMGINYKNGKMIQVNTANGVALAYKVTLDKVRVGELEVHQVEALIQESGLEVGLLGMSFLKRTDMHNEGQQMVLTKRF